MNKLKKKVLLLCLVTVLSSVFSTPMKSAHAATIETPLASSAVSYIEGKTEINTTDALLLSATLVELDYVGGDYPKRTSTTYGSFQKSSALGIASALAAVSSLGGTSAFLSIAGILMSESSSPTVYYTYTYSTWRTNGITYVEATFKFYNNSSRTDYITSHTIKRQYSDDGLDDYEEAI